MAKIVIEVPEKLREVGEAMKATLATLERMLARTDGGKAIDYAAVEQQLGPRAA